MRSGAQIRRLKIETQRLLYSGITPFVRLEWYDVSGGTENVIFGVNDGQTRISQVSDNVRALVKIMDENSVKLVNDEMIEVGDAVWMFDPDQNISKKNLVIVHKVRSMAISGTGTVSGSTVTVSGAAYTVDVYKGWWLFSADKRYQIKSNTATTFELELNGGTLDTPVTFEVMPCTEWFPVVDEPDFGDAITSAVGEYVLMQNVYCKRLPVASKGNEI